MARPPNPNSQRYELRAPAELLELWQQAATAEGVELAVFARQQLTKAARRILAKTEVSEKATALSKKVRSRA